MQVHESALRFWAFALVIALLAAQWAAQDHEFEHVRYELAMADYADSNVGPTASRHERSAQDDDADPHGGAPSLGHSRDRCLVFQSLACAAVPGPLPKLAAALPEIGAVAQPSLPLPHAPRIPFLSRAPPDSPLL